MSENKKMPKTLQYSLPNGITIEYPSSKQAYYLSTILKSMFKYDRFIRRMIVGLAGRDMRKAMEIFLEFCNSGHIEEDEIFKMEQSKGEYTLPYHVVARVLLRMNRRFYDGDYSYLKNLFYCSPKDPRPNHFIRFAILQWLVKKLNSEGPNGVKGYHAVRDLKGSLFMIGVSNEIAQRELLYLLKAKCILAEHFQIDRLDNEDLIKITPAGFVHLKLLDNVDYLGAMAEDIWFDDKELAKLVAERIKNKRTHYSLDAALQNAHLLTEYLKEKRKLLISPDIYLKAPDWDYLVNIKDFSKKIEASVKKRNEENPWFEIEKKYKSGQLVEGTVTGENKKYGIFITVEEGVTGLLHHSKFTSEKFKIGQKIKVKIEKVCETTQKMRLNLAE